MKKTANTLLSRRGFVAGAGALGLVSLAGCAPKTSAETEQGLSETSEVQYDEQVYVSGCRNNCNGPCMHQLTVRDGVICMVEPFELPDGCYTGICSKGAANIHRTYNPERIKYPMRRVAGTERGAGEWERISWDDAIAEIKEKLTAIIDQYGSKAIIKDFQSGNCGTALGGGAHMTKLMNALGMTLSVSTYDCNSYEGTFRVLGNYNYDYSNEPSTLHDADMIVVWGTNPVFTEPHIWRNIRIGQDNGAKVVCIDPVRTATSYKADQHIPITPGTDLAVILAVTNYVLENGKQDEAFLLNRTNAPFMVRVDTGEMLYVDGAGEETTEADYYVFDRATNAVVPFAEASEIAIEGEGEVNGVKVRSAFSVLKDHYKQFTLEEASKTSGIPLEVLTGFAQEYADSPAVSLNVTYGLDHYMNGHLTFQALCIMQAVRGNFARPGSGFTGMFMPVGGRLNTAALSKVTEPKETGAIPSFMLFDVWRDQAFMGEPYPLKALITCGSNPMSNYPAQARWFTDVFPNMEYWIVMDNQWGDSARYADIVLPATTWYEQPEIKNPQNSPYTCYSERVIDPLWETKTDAEMIAAIGEAMGCADFDSSMAPEDYVKLVLDSDEAREKGITLEALEERHAIRFIGDNDETHVTQGSDDLPFHTSHGRLTIYWENPVPRVDYGQTFTDEERRRERLPYFRYPEQVRPDSPLAEKYPLVYFQLHERFLTHTQHHDNPVLNELCPEPLLHICSTDAQARGIAAGDVVEVHNDNGHCVLKAVVDDNFPSGIVSIPHGWQRHQFIAGGYQEVISAQLDPWGVGAPYYDARVDVRKYEG